MELESKCECRDSHCNIKVVCPQERRSRTVNQFSVALSVDYLFSGKDKTSLTCHGCEEKCAINVSREDYLNSTQEERAKYGI